MTAPLQITWHGREKAAVTEIVKIDINRGTSVETAVEVPSLDAGAHPAAQRNTADALRYRQWGSKRQAEQAPRCRVCREMRSPERH